ncbi:thiamine pyrophosphate-binding protein [Actinomadura madurae]|uniref:thiamine pyrophosphate-binding protein n=2 Tax=Actinomadura madurae TaxID=1993 RepID=UPI0020D23B13|nr:thiamine pyrophosphate-binding protein [Actinomadura madurae]MCP9982783.1 thiamine pyrophosphate-binding protein [Actinomadura madurae]
MHVGERLAALLVNAGVRRVFGVPGGQTTPLYHGIAGQHGVISHTLMRDERSAAFAADAYARMSGRVGVCDATVGPGVSNLVSGLLEAYTSSVPMLAIIADIPRHWETRRRFGSASQGFEQRSYLEPCVKYYGRVELPENLDGLLAAALRIATSGRPGPVVLEIPDDVFSADYPEPPHGSSAVTPLSTVYPQSRTSPDPAAVEGAVELLRHSRKPLLLAGGGALSAGAGDEVRRLAERLGALVATTLNGKGVLSEHHPLAVGPAGTFGLPLVNELLAEADCVVFIGTKAAQGATLNWTLPPPGTPIVHLDLDATEIGRNFPQSLGLECDAKLGARALADALPERGPGDWELERVRRLAEEWWRGTPGDGVDGHGAVKPQAVMRTLSAVMGPDDVLVTDASLSSGWGAAHWRAPRAGRAFVAPRGLAGLGWGLPAAIGSALALRDAGSAARVYCVAGDGGWAYSQSELETLARLRLPVVATVLNNSVLAWTRHSAAQRYPGSEPISQDFTDVDFAAAAVAMGTLAHRCTTPDQFAEAATKAAADHTGAPVVLEVISSKTETPVLKPKGRQTATAY